ncbi:MAG: hypothetical protein PWR03_381 [Tenuifilum sp.]|jgi:GLPGLI family protein|uniref:GLPGLI family protein n=1 Tax=Tenuifilum sp. TaxID=2760880 RepID=UPI0024ABD6E5|nr:GLPGLI family protein [Tenuifilum sp.]MDI3526198.1 hypothetical protein [Tenuifilum sp.]
MKRTLVVLILLISKIVSAQNYDYGFVQYERILNFDNNPKMTNFNLYFTPKHSTFIENNTKEKEDSREKVSYDLKNDNSNELDLSINMNIDGSKYVVLTNFYKNIIQSQQSLLKSGKVETYIIEEELPKIDWNIENEFKDINKIKVQKATCRFRGRDYVAWFTNSIPVKYGPWKFNGLPGLIISISDSKNEVIFNAIKIKVPFEIPLDIKESQEITCDCPKISLEEYIKMKKKQDDEFIKLFNSKLPRGAVFIQTSKKGNSIELEY